jgi:GTP diphosphokinase / guanosine-3',5'-bis(diphosphate) 3'-diphosphatase
MPEPGSEVSFILNAAKFAAAKHKLQTRKDSEGTPYINHPLEVAELISRVARVSDPEVIAAAILHDTIEDTQTSKDEVRTTFGERVLSLVMECTDDKSLPKAERKRLQVLNAPHKSDEAKLIKIADKISNIKDIANVPPPDWSWQRRWDYLDWAQAVFEGLRGVSFELDQAFDEEMKHCRSVLDSQRPEQSTAAPQAR